MLPLVRSPTGALAKGVFQLEATSGDMQVVIKYVC